MRERTITAALLLGIAAGCAQGTPPDPGTAIAAGPRPLVREIASRAAKRAGIIENPEKIGIGAVQSFGLARMIDDIRLVGPSWFYTWTPALPEIAVDDWLTGEGVQLGGSDTDAHLVLDSSSYAWILQDIPVTPGSSYDLSLVTGGSPDAAGGISVSFRDDEGARLSDGWLPLDSAGVATLGRLAAPAGTAQARIIAWGEAGTLTIDDVSLSRCNADAVRNGGFRSGISVDAMDFHTDHVPMVWGRKHVEATELDPLRGEQVILGFNEPDHSDQSAMSVSEAIALWPELMDTGAHLGSPAPTTPGTLGERSWLGRFMDRADDADLRVDFIAVHYYSADKNVDAFETFLNRTYAAYDRPIWITEWALVDWDDPGRFSSEETATFFADAAQMLDDLTFVERHAWFGLYDGMDSLNINTHLIDANGDLTPVGEAFVDIAPDRDIFGAVPADDLWRGAGDDTLLGYGGNDILYGGLEKDVLRGRFGADTFRLGEVDRLQMGADTITDFRPDDGEHLEFSFRGEEIKLASVAQVEAFGDGLNVDDDLSTANEIDGTDVVLSFRELRQGSSRQDCG